MAKRQMFTKRSRVLGLPIGKRRRDWRKLGLVGAGVVSTVATGLGAGQALSRRDSEDSGEESEERAQQDGQDEQA